MLVIDIIIFTTHSNRDTFSSIGGDLGVTTSDNLKAADWSTESVFRKFYYRPTHNILYMAELCYFAILSTPSLLPKLQTLLSFTICKHSIITKQMQFANIYWCKLEDFMESIWWNMYKFYTILTIIYSCQYL